jgi:hypothetical protein
MNSKTLPEPICFVTKRPYEDEEYAKWVAITEVINEQAKSDDDLALGLALDEKTIYFANRLSCQCNVDGVTNFFDYGIGPYYHTVIEALRRLEALPMIDVLEGIRRIVMGDHEITAGSIQEHAYESYPRPPYEDDVPPWEADLERVDCSEADEDFHRLLQHFSASYFDSNGYSFASSIDPAA